jgi:hypothetical protein
MTAEPTDATYTDAALTAVIESKAVSDLRGLQPTVLSFSTTPPTYIANTNWIETYDLNAAAAKVWDEKAAAAACNFDFSADGASYTRSQVIAHYNKMASKYRSQSRPGSAGFISSQREVTPTGELIETSPIIDRYSDDGVFNT